jgi:tetratricopeptide (TPR) repeat protein
MIDKPIARSTRITSHLPDESQINNEAKRVQDLWDKWKRYKANAKLPHFISLRSYPDKSLVPQEELQTCLNECIRLGESIQNTNQREELEKLAREISEYIFHLYGIYPASAITPYLEKPDAKFYPYPRNSYFTGREPELNSIQNFFQQKEPSEVCIVTLSGMGGVGKSQIAIEYAYKFQEQYQGIYWLQADNSFLFLLSVEELASKLIKDACDHEDPATIARMLKNYLERESRWLLIIDNADDLSILNGYLPEKGDGCILITTRLAASEIDSVWHPILINAFSADESKLFLRNRTQEKYPSDPESANKLLDQLGRLPLALHQAGSYISENNLTFNEYLNQYNTLAEGKKLRSSPSKLSAEHTSVSTTYILALEQVAIKDPLAAELIRTCAFLNPEAIPEELFIKNPKIWTDLLTDQFYQFCSNAAHYSLIQWNATNELLSIHPVVQQVIRDELTHEQQEQYIQKVILALNAIFPKEEEINFGPRKILRNCDRLSPHCLQALEWIKEFSILDSEAASLIHKTGCYLFIRCRYDEAEEFYQEALKIRRKLFAENKEAQKELDVASSLNNLAELKEIRALYHEAEPLFDEALKIRQNRLSSSDHYLVGQSLHNLARLYFHLGRYVEAKQYYQEALEINESNLEAKKTILPKDFLKNFLARSYNDIAKLYVALAQYDEAEKYYQKALSINKKILGENNLQYASNLDNLGDVYLAQGFADQAENYYSQAFNIRISYLKGDDYNAIADSYTRLGRLYLVLEDFDKSQTYYEKVLTIRKKVFGDKHPAVANSYNNLALLYQEQRNNEKCREYYENALKIYEDNPTYQQHPSLALLYYNFAIFYHQQKKYPQAEEYYNKALELYTKMFNDTHPLAANCYYNLALLYDDKEQIDEAANCLGNLGNCEYQQSRYTEAELCYKKALELYEQLPEPPDLNLLSVLDNLALLYQEQEDYEKAEPLFRRALTLTEEISDENDLDVAYSLDNLALLYQDQEKYTQAEPLFQRSLQIKQQILDSQDLEIAGSLDNLAFLYQDMERYPEAENLLTQALELRKQISGSDDLANSLDNLAFLYQDMERYPEAEDLFKQALELRKQALEEDDPDVAYSLGNLASLYEEQENFAEAKEFLQLSLNILQKRLGARHTYIKDIKKRLEELQKKQ